MASAPQVSDAEERRTVAATATRRLRDSIDAVLGDRLVIEPGTKPDYFNDGVSIDGFSLLERCPRRAAHPADDYLDSVANARRRVGLLVMRRLSASPDTTVADAVAAVMDDAEYWPTRLRQWVDALDPAGRAAVASAVTTWCHGALRLVGRDPRIRWADPAMPPKWNVPERVVQLRGSVDASMGTPGRGEKLLVLGDGLPGGGDRLRAGYAALLRAVASRAAPVRVTVASPATGVRQPFAVGVELLELATDRVVELVSHRATPETAPPVPGRGCVHCHLLDLCEEGTARVGEVTSQGGDR